MQEILAQREGEYGRRVTVLEALAEETERVGLSRSNQSTPSAGDADDQ